MCIRDSIKTTVEFKQAVSLEEEAAKKAEEEKRKQEAEAAISQLNEVLQAEALGDGQSQNETSKVPAKESAESTTASVGINGTIAANPLGSGKDATRCV